MPEDPPPHIPERVVEDNRSLCAGGMLQMWRSEEEVLLKITFKTNAVLPVELFASRMSNETVSTVKVGNVVPGFGRLGPPPAEETRAAREQGARVVRENLHGTELAVSVHSFEPEAELKSKEVRRQFTEVVSVRSDPSGVDVKVPVDEPGFERLLALVPLLVELGFDRVA